MKRFLLAVAVAGICFGASARQVTLKKSAPACLTNEELSEFTGALYREDYDTLAAIIAGGRCTLLSEEIKANTIDSSALRGWAKVRILGAKGSAVIYTTTEAIRRD